MIDLAWFWYVITFIAGALAGLFLSALLTVGSNYEKMQETYNYGFEAGKKSVLEAKDTSIEN